MGEVQRPGQPLHDPQASWRGGGPVQAVGAHEPGLLQRGVRLRTNRGKGREKTISTAAGPRRRQRLQQAWKFCIFWERRSEPKKIQEPKKTKKKEMKRGERERKEKRGERE